MSFQIRPSERKNTTTTTKPGQQGRRGDTGLFERQLIGRCASRDLPHRPAEQAGHLPPRVWIKICCENSDSLQRSVSLLGRISTPWATLGPQAQSPVLLTTPGQQGDPTGHQTSPPAPCSVTQDSVGVLISDRHRVVRRCLDHRCPLPSPPPDVLPDHVTQRTFPRTRPW